MKVIHLEDMPETRESLARGLKVSKARKLGDCDYVATDKPAAVMDDLRRDRVKALVLDLGLDARSNTEQHLASQLKAAVKNPGAWQPPAGFKAYEVAVLARRHHVPFAVLTNYADGLGLPVQDALNGLIQAFGANAAFTKEPAGLEACAEWVRSVVP